MSFGEKNNSEKECWRGCIICSFLCKFFHLLRFKAEENFGWFGWQDRPGIGAGKLRIAEEGVEDGVFEDYFADSDEPAVDDLVGEAIDEGKVDNADVGHMGPKRTITRNNATEKSDKGKDAKERYSWLEHSGFKNNTKPAHEVFLPQSILRKKNSTEDFNIKGKIKADKREQNRIVNGYEAGELASYAFNYLTNGRSSKY